MCRRASTEPAGGGGQHISDVGARDPRCGCAAAPFSSAPQLRVFNGHPDGVVSIKFTAEEPADKCVQLMNGRFFGGRQIVAAKWDGWTNYNVKVGGRAM